MKKLFLIFAAVFKKNEELQPCGYRTVKRPTEMNFIDWRLFIEEEVVSTELKNIQIKHELGSKERFLRKLTRTIIEANILG